MADEEPKLEQGKSVGRKELQKGAAQGRHEGRLKNQE